MNTYFRYNSYVKNTFYSYSFGCRVNETEKEEIDRQMLAAGFKYSSDKTSLYIINTCSVTHKAEREARQHIYQVRRKFPEAKIIITGCSATYWTKNMLDSILPVDFLIENIHKEFLVKILLKRLSNQSRFNLTGWTQGVATSKFIDSGRLLVKIQDGCQRFCSFCIVPYLRGLPKSIKIQDLRSKIQEYEGQVQEAILTAINTEAYGYDTGETFIDLVQSVIDQTIIPRISFGSIHPWSITKRFLELYKKILPKKRLVDFFHIALQSGSNKILNLMKRGYTKEEMMDKLRSIKKINDFAFIGTDVIVGFLDETDKDFDETYDFLKESSISKFHIFRFSKRQNTAAFYLSKQLKEPSPQIKVKRAQALAELGKLKYEAFLQKHVGKTFSGLFLKQRVEDFQETLLSNQIPVFVKAPKDSISEIKNIRVTEFKNGKLFGVLV